MSQRFVPGAQEIISDVLHTAIKLHVNIFISYLRTTSNPCSDVTEFKESLWTQSYDLQR
jgi:hypothetical protein